MSKGRLYDNCIGYLMLYVKKKRIQYVDFFLLRFRGSRFKGSALPLATEAASSIKKVTLVLRSHIGEFCLTKKAGFAKDYELKRQIQDVFG